MTKDYYKILGINRYAADDEIKKAYRKLAIKYHPDKNQSAFAEERFKEIAEAYEVLTDKSKRMMYDQYGSYGQQSCGSGQTYGRGGIFSYHFHGDPRATFAQFFGDSDPFGAFFRTNTTATHKFETSRAKGSPNISKPTVKRPLQQDPPVEHEIFVTLEDIDKGCVKKMKLQRMVCDNNGSSFKEEKVLDVDIKPGWKAGTKITFPKEGDQSADRIPADIVFIIRDKPHPLFKREGNDLRYVVDISLKQALCGTAIEVPTLEEDSVTVNTDGNIISPDTIERVPGKGLPFSKEPNKRGDLIVVFDIKFPDTLTSIVKDMLEEVLPN